MTFKEGDKLLFLDTTESSRCYGQYLVGTYVREATATHKVVATVEKFNLQYPFGNGYESVWSLQEIVKPYEALSKLEKIIYEV